MLNQYSRFLFSIKINALIIQPLLFINVHFPSNISFWSMVTIFYTNYTRKSFIYDIVDVK